MNLQEVPTDDLVAEISRRVRNPVVIRAIAHCAAGFGVEQERILARDRHQMPSIARIAAMYLARKHTYMSLQEISKAFLREDHGTTLHAVNKAKAMIETCPSFRRVIETFQPA